MVPDLKILDAETASDAFRSHPHKKLRVHTNGVLAGTLRHTNSHVAAVAALFHDVGKLNPNFQLKLDGQTPSGYANHAYLSAWAFLAFTVSNGAHLKEWDLANHELLALLAIIAHHHGKFPSLRGIFSCGERERLLEFLATNPTIDAHDFLNLGTEFEPFDLANPEVKRRFDIFDTESNAAQFLAGIKKPFDFWLDSQFAFAALIHADKRDAGDNLSFKRAEDLKWAQNNFSNALQKYLPREENPNSLNAARNRIRKEAVENLRIALKNGERIFSLTAPTGSGKTFTLLDLADAIRAHNGELATLYGLPFLSITEQVEGICRDIWKENPDFVSRFDSRAHDDEFDELVKRAESEPEAARELAQRAFSSLTFDAGFAITTFVQIFESLLSNRNATLLKLPNFAKTIFLLDEIQSLPPRLYLFFAAYLRKFCEKFDCYAVLSTATMPHFEMVEQVGAPKERKPQTLFTDYQTPTELLDYEPLYKLDVFNRYQIQARGEWSHEQLCDELEAQDKSVLVILNTIADTKAVYNELKNRSSDAKIVLLNTHFTLEDRRRKISDCKSYLEQQQRVILISTQLIEAGVDIDFPVVFRDLCPLPNLIQSAGRCNRNGSMTRGQVLFFSLVGDKGKPRAHVIYRHPSDKTLLEKTVSALPETTEESGLLTIQKEFFKAMAHNFAVGDHPLYIGDARDESANLIEQMLEFNYPAVGSFRLIDEKNFGEQFQIYVPQSDDDAAWKELLKRRIELAKGYASNLSYEDLTRLKQALGAQIRAMSGRVVTVRGKAESLPPLDPQLGEKDICGMRKLVKWEFDYSFDEGLFPAGQATAMI